LCLKNTAEADGACVVADKPPLLALQHSFLRTPAMVTRMDHNNFVLRVPSAAQQESDEDTALEEDGANPHAEHEEALDKLREALAMTVDGDPSTSGREGLTAIVVHDSYQKLPNPTLQVGPKSDTHPL